MPDPQLPLTPEPSSPAPGGTPTAAPAPEPWKAGPDAPAWARGKTADEIMRITDTLMQEVQQPAPAPPATAPTPGQPIDPNAYATGQDVLNAQSAAVQQFTPTLQRLAQQNAALTVRHVATDPRFADVFQKYGPEVHAMIARVPVEQRTVDIVEGAAKLVKADHLEELSRERANQILQGMEPTIRPTGGGATPPSPTPDLSLKSDKLPSDWRDRAAKVGLTERDLDEFCSGAGISREQFFQQFEKPGGLIVEIGKVKGV